ncbi:hypothetical protein [Fructilactobacillus florum]|uniref:hypothetical protein n=1 Tax=Fructilactobacillus florum TaxID=640331 RepID=UPI000B2A9B3B
MLVTGHQHRALAGKLFGVPYVQPGHRGNYVGRIQLTLEADAQNHYQITASNQKLLKTGEQKPAIKTSTAFRQTEKAMEAWLARPLAHIEGSLTYDDPFQVRLRGGAFINFIQKNPDGNYGV